MFRNFENLKNGSQSCLAPSHPQEPLYLQSIENIESITQFSDATLKTLAM